MRERLIVVSTVVSFVYENRTEIFMFKSRESGVIKHTAASVSFMYCVAEIAVVTFIFCPFDNSREHSLLENWARNCLTPCCEHWMCVLLSRGGCVSRGGCGLSRACSSARSAGLRLSWRPPISAQPWHVEALQPAKVLMVRKEREREAVRVMNYIWRATLNSSPCQHIITPDCVIAWVTDTGN